jgi:nitrite reductase (NADH) small subunit
MEGDWISVGLVDDVPRQGARTVRTPGPPVAVFRTADDAVYALVNVCPHRGGPLSEGIVFGQTVACPLHNWVIELSTGVAQLPDVGSTPTVPVKIVDGHIYLAKAALEISTDQPGQAACRTPCNAA